MGYKWMLKRIGDILFKTQLARKIVGKPLAYFNIYTEEFQTEKAGLKNVNPELPTICFAPDACWNTIEYTLPVFIYLKENYSCNLISVISYRELGERSFEESILYKKLVEVSDVLVCNTSYTYPGNTVFEAIIQYIRNIVFENKLEEWIRNVFADIALCVYPSDDAVKWIKESNQNIRIIAVNHAASYTVLNGIAYNHEKWFSSADMFLYPDVGCYREKSSKILNKIFLTGPTVYDEWWMEKLRQISQVEEFDKRISKKQKKKIMLIMPSLYEPIRFTQEEYDKLNKFIRNNCGKYTFVFKFHPKELKRHQELYLHSNGLEIDSGDIFISDGFPLLAVASIMDCVIVLGLTTAAVDALASDTPVIEFYDNYEVPQRYCFDGNKYGTLLRKHDLVPYTDSVTELEQLVHQILYEDLWSKYIGKYRYYLNMNNDACKRFTDCLMGNEIDWKISNEEYIRKVNEL